ncbi:hypothetical protein KPL71_017966 [Citrus sinensis]|uniref:Uncharacterized protein n=1 Tax=Citrus sinensis TaxID=2711 RepID=A0ACB8JU44_CITSI|nr:hypothetical protein KPL71_017966 [Citrus sinensis]
MNGDVDMASAYNDDGIGIHIENHSGSGRSGDFMDVDLLEEEPCIKCNRRGENLLVCSQSGCPISVHENCLSCGVKFDDVGNFYCPYCWYKRELTRTKELWKKAMETKKQLACFIDSKSFSGDKKKENCRTDKGNELNMSSLHQERNYSYGGCEDRRDDVQVENLSEEVEGELENDGDNTKTADSCDKFKRALENQSNPLAVHSHTGDKINHSREKTPGIESLVNYTSKERPNEENENVCETHELELLEDGEGIPLEDLGCVDGSGHEKIAEDQLQEEPYTACCVGEEFVVDILLNLWKGDIPDTEKLKEERREEEENVDPTTLRTEMFDSDIEPTSMRLRCVAGSSKKAQSRGIDSPRKLRSSKGANPKKTKSQNVDSSKKLSPPKGANSEKIAQARNEKSTASKKSTQVSGGKFTNFTFASEKRRRLHWTAEEEEMLKEGVEKFSTKVNKNLPWKKVLEFGCDVFDPTRTPSDLKDKWRNIMSRESSAISRK